MKAFAQIGLAVSALFAAALALSRNGDGGARPPRAQWAAPSRFIGAAGNDSPPRMSGRVRVRRRGRLRSPFISSASFRLKRLVNGPEDNVYEKYVALVLGRTNEVNATTTYWTNTSECLVQLTNKPTE
jgi:hypothetical protein